YKTADRVPAFDADEEPEEGQFYARDDKDEALLVWNGKLDAAADGVFLRVFADGKPFAESRAKPGPDGRYALSATLKPGLVRYSAEFGTSAAGEDTVMRSVGNLVCGDAFVIDGQSNAVATDWGEGDFPETSEWIRTFGATGGDPGSVRWGNASRKAREDKLAIGYWAYDLAQRLVERHRVPICIINGAVGGTRVDQHQRNADNPMDRGTIYGRLLWRVRQARLEDGIRGLFWHQGENDQGADGPTGGYGHETYRALFLEMAGAWREDYPNIQRFYMFQIWPKACAMGRDGSDSRLREVQRTLPRAFARMSIMSSLGIEPEGGCHYPPEGYAQMARLVAPLVEQFNYGVEPAGRITPPDLVRVRFANATRDAIVLEFDQPVRWDHALASQFRLEGAKVAFASSNADGSTVTLRLASPTEARTISYIDGDDWSQKAILRGENGIAALTFCEVPIEVQD
ncbi:MAG: sialate O-acetylesterase, partial [Phycisphaerales bacterium]